MYWYLNIFTKLKLIYDKIIFYIFFLIFKSFLILEIFDFYKELNTAQRLSFIGGVYCIVKALQNLDNGGFIWIAVSLVSFFAIYLFKDNKWSF